MGAQHQIGLGNPVHQPQSIMLPSNPTETAGSEHDLGERPIMFGLPPKVNLDVEDGLPVFCPSAPSASSGL